ncbi:MAG: corrinoid protein [Defluviitaleaceae bacterium]|nr:corrinoid protein [Defluviitaleaceae bacterium]MCL2835756.1 corrinoid protein [Defluviitaleaceae bacterium]
MLDKITDSVYKYEMAEIEGLVKTALDSGITAKDILIDGLMKGMEAVGESFKEGDYFVPEVLMSAKTMAAGLEIIKPMLLDTSGAGFSRGKAVIGTVQGDLHDIGKKLVGMFMEGAGYEVIDIGIDVPADKFIEEAKTRDADFLCMSAMLTTTMKQMKVVIDKMKEAGIYGRCKPVVGGAPLTHKFAEEIGAHYSFDAASAVDLLNGLLAN